MRVRHDDESGAVLAFVAVCLVVLLGMLALTVDLGRAVAIKRDMVNAADAAALAGAQACAMNMGVATAKANALETAEANGPNASETLQVAFSAPECDTPGTGQPKTVTVTEKTFVDYFVAPVLGFDGTDVAASATAIWGPAATAVPVPFVAAKGAFQGPCAIPDVAIGTECYLWFDNDDFDGSTFGTLNLDAWNVSPDENCANKELGQNEHYAANGGYDGPPLPPLNYPDPTWVCAATGNAQPMYFGLAQAVGKIIALPVTDGCIRKGSPCEVFNVVGFARARLQGVYKANEAPSGCGSPPANASAHCIIIRWEGGTLGNGGQMGGLPFGINEIRLVR